MEGVALGFRRAGVLDKTVNLQRAMGQIGAGSGVHGLDGPVCRWILAYRHEFHGEVVRWLVNGVWLAGVYSVGWDGTDGEGVRQTNLLRLRDELRAVAGRVNLAQPRGALAQDVDTFDVQLPRDWAQHPPVRVV